VFFGDPPPNDGTFIDVGSILPNSSDIRGIAPFRQNVIVTFAEGTIIGSLGTYDASNAHTPIFDDPVAQYGSISHRSIVSYGDDTLMMDLVGVPSLKRTVFTGTMRPERVSDLVDPEITAMLNNLSFASLEDRVFAIYHQREGQFMFFVPNQDTLNGTTETTALAFIYRPTLNVAGWARFDGWNFTCGCRSQQGNIFFGDARGNIWLYNPLVYTDYLGDLTINGGNGLSLSFEWELPWSDFNARTLSKQSKYLSVDTRGTATFTVSMFVDRYLMLGATPNPLLSMSMIGADFANLGGGVPVGDTTRNAGNQYRYAWPAKFELAKLHFSGQITGPLKFVSISMLYQLGTTLR
jgi:hypothetical protein